MPRLTCSESDVRQIASSVKTIVITRPDFFEGETALVGRLFEHGMARLHLRKPRASRQELAEWIEAISPLFRHRIVLHDHHSLAHDYALGGIHLNSRNPEVPLWAERERSERPFTLSRSCHSLAEVQQHGRTLDYMFLSPIYDSISKEGYGAAFSRRELEEARAAGLLSDKVYALGGISAERLPELTAMGFQGAAVLGDLWLSPDPCARLAAYQ